MLSVVLIILFVTTSLKSEEFGVFFEIEENYFYSDEDNIWSGKVDSLLRCSQMCAREDACKSAIFFSKRGKCSLHGETRQTHPEKFFRKEGFFYVEKVVI